MAHREAVRPWCGAPRTRSRSLMHPAPSGARVGVANCPSASLKVVRPRGPPFGPRIFPPRSFDVPRARTTTKHLRQFRGASSSSFSGQRRHVPDACALPVRASFEGGRQEREGALTEGARCKPTGGRKPPSLSRSVERSASVLRATTTRRAVRFGSARSRGGRALGGAGCVSLLASIRDADRSFVTHTVRPCERPPLGRLPFPSFGLPC